MDGIFDEIDGHLEGILPSDMISYLLGKIINFSFRGTQQSLQERRAHYASLKSALVDWDSRLAVGYYPFSRSLEGYNPFPSLWMFQPCHSEWTCCRDTLLLTDNSQ
jgi:hypothetical protein